MEMVAALLLGVLLAAVGAAVSLLAAWFRWGRSTAARRWARRKHIDQAADYANLEALALAWTPMLGQTLLLAGLVVPLVALLGIGTPAAKAVIGLLMVLELGAWIVMLLMTVYRWILPLWMYPGWLREIRRAEVDHLRGPAEAFPPGAQVPRSIRP